ncbi:MAG: hypothetical protein ACFFCS_29265 [Candidatus Hodarchaeota archaeon]
MVIHSPQEDNPSSKDIDYNATRQLIDEKLHDGWVFVNAKSLDLFHELLGGIWDANQEEDQQFIMSFLNIPGKNADSRERQWTFALVKKTTRLKNWIGIQEPLDFERLLFMQLSEDTEGNLDIYTDCYRASLNEAVDCFLETIDEIAGIQY